VSEDLEEEEVHARLVVRKLPQRRALATALSGATTYIEARIKGDREAIFSCAEMYETLFLVQLSDPQMAVKHATPMAVDELAKIVPLGKLVDLVKMKAELPTMLRLAGDATFNAADVDLYSEGVLTWWRTHGTAIPAWRAAARIVFALTPNSASCERVFALLRVMYDDTQKSALAGQVQAALMLCYNERVVG
jgi:hypothetical protein